MTIKNKKFLITGGAGFLGSHVVDKLLARGVPGNSARFADSRSDRAELPGVPVTNILIPRSKDYDLRKWENCLMVTRGVDVVIHLAAFVGGIQLNQAHPGKMFYDNIMMGVQLMEAARQNDVEKFVALGTVCAYPVTPPFHSRKKICGMAIPSRLMRPMAWQKKCSWYRRRPIVSNTA